jgi:hypothetical protein
MIMIRNREEENGGGAGTRTPDTGIMIPLLYQLSYTATRKIRGTRYCIVVFLSRKSNGFIKTQKPSPLRQAQGRL